LILNVNRDPPLRDARAKNADAGSYTSPARTPEEAIELAARLHGAIAIVWHSFNESERPWIHSTFRMMLLPVHVNFEIAKIKRHFAKG
jgi:hypothetical protein